jgi:glycosyltransferase involved in cell wall biosynthesis
MTESINVIHICNEVGLGGTERGIISMCRAMRYGVFHHTVHCLMRAGARAGELDGVADLNSAGPGGKPLEVLCANGKFRVAVIHRAGGAEPRWSEVLKICKGAGIAVVIEINIFGLLDDSAEDEIIDWHLHISKSSYCSFRERIQGTGYSRLDRHRVLYIPVETARFSSTQDRDRLRLEGRRQLGIGADDFVLLRTGRADFRKWGDLLMYSMAETIRRIPKARFVLLSAPASRAWYLRHSGYAEKVWVLPPTGDDGKLAQAYAISDVYAHSSRRGESFGVSLIEAMAASLPVVVNSTPWRDNAQIEVVDHLKTGLIANSPACFADAIAHLHAQPDLREKMGGLGRDKAVNMYDAAVVCKSLAGLIGATLREKNLPCPAAPVLGIEPLPTLPELEVFWTNERGERERMNWLDVPPHRVIAPFRQLAWGVVDSGEWLGQRLGLVT